MDAPRSRNQFTTEGDIYKYLHLHPCHTEHEMEADAFIVPAQTVSAIWAGRKRGPKGEKPTRDEGSKYMKAGQSKNDVARYQRCLTESAL